MVKDQNKNIAKSEENQGKAGVASGDSKNRAIYKVWDNQWAFKSIWWAFRVSKIYGSG